MRAAGMVTLSGFLMRLHRRRAERQRRLGDAGAGAVAETEAAARQARSGRAPTPAGSPPNTAARRDAARCSDHDAVTIVRVAAMRRASARIVSAGTPVIAAAQSASFGWPSLSPIR